MVLWTVRRRPSNPGTIVSLFASVALVLVGCETSSPSTGESEPRASAPEGPAAESAAAVEYPETRRQDVTETVHGTEVSDPYRWLEESTSDVETWQKKQDRLTRKYLEGYAERSEIRRQLEELHYVETYSSPIRRGDRVFFERRPARKQKGIYYWRPAGKPDASAEVLLDPNDMGGETNISIGGIWPSRDGEKVAYTVKVNNQDAATLKVLDVDTGKTSETDVIPGARWAHPVWTPDSKGFYYTRFPTSEEIPPAKRPGRADVRYHRLGTDASSDRVVHEETGDPRTFLGVDMSWNGKWLIATVAHGWSRTDVFYRKREATSADWKPLVVGNDATYDVRAWGGHFYIRTDEGSSNYRLFRVPVSSPERSNWKEIIPEKKDAVLDGFSVVGGRLAVKYLVDARSRLAIYRPDGRRVRRVKLPGTGYASGISGTPDRKKGYFSYQSFETPEKIMRVSVEQPGTDVWKGTEVPVDPTNFRVKQVWYESKDGTEVSMYLVLPKGAADEGPIPFLMYGYGGFKVSLQPYFVEGVIPWLRAGGGYAMPNLRGGGEYGEKWHRAGMLKKKQNTFDDFIAAGEYLTENGYTRSDELAIWGASNGGLLVSAVTTQRPDLFGAVLCEVPLTDMVRYHKFGPAKTWIHEYGNPENPEHFEFLYDYSPYHNVEPRTDYPAFLMMSSASDDRVHPMHARKFTAALQYADTTPSSPALFRLERKAGHGGAAMVRKEIAKATDRLSFLMDQFGMEPATPGE